MVVVICGRVVRGDVVEDMLFRDGGVASIEH